ncbi:MAG: hypothetical protein RMK57_16185 [Bryobacterales bacterium]|nr:hypothetical protein [Bryobacterales bacterium]
MANRGEKSLPPFGERRLGRTRTPARRRSSSNRALVRRLKDAIVAKVEANEIKATVSDFVRLVELEKQMERSSPRGIEVRWVGPSEAEFGNER